MLLVVPCGAAWSAGFDTVAWLDVDVRFLGVRSLGAEGDSRSYMLPSDLDFVGVV